MGLIWTSSFAIDVQVNKNGDIGFDSSRSEFGVEAWRSEGSGGVGQRVDIIRAAAGDVVVPIPGDHQD